MVITSVSTDNHYNRVFILYLLLFTLEDMIVAQGPIIPVPAHWDPMSRSDVVPRRWLQLTGQAPEEGWLLQPGRRRPGWLGGECGAGFGVGAALLSRRSKRFPVLPCLHMGEEHGKS